MSEGHTKGPWAVEVQEFGSVITDGSASIATAFSSKVMSGEALPHEANARLIAAAPEMLEALREFFTSSHFDIEASAKEGDEDATQAWLTKARAAISKATGQTP